MAFDKEALAIAEELHIIRHQMLNLKHKQQRLGKQLHARLSSIGIVVKHTQDVEVEKMFAFLAARTKRDQSTKQD